MLQAVAIDAEQEDSALLTAAELARAIGVSATTIKNWTELNNRPLKTVVTSDGAVRFTWSHLDEFCRTHPRLRGVMKIQRSAPAAHNVAPTSQIEELKSLARDLRNAANSNLQAAIEAARQAEEAARAHRRQMEHLAASMAAYDAALTQLTAPSTIHD